MSKFKMIWPALVLVVSLATLSAPAAGNAVVAVPGHVPAVVSQLTPVGDLPGSNILNLAIGLPLRNQAAMQELLAQMYDPQSTNFHQYLTPEQFTEQFGPTTNDYQAVLDFAQANGLEVTRTYGNRVIVDVKGSVASINKSFKINLRTYHHPTDARDFYAPDSEPMVTASAPILHIQGLDNYVLPHSFLRKYQPNLAQPNLGSGLFGSYIGSDFRNAYLPGSTNFGSGQMVGLFQLDGYFTSDINTYESIAGLTNVPLKNVLLDGFDGSPGPANDEVCLDIEMSVSMAPALAAVVVFEAGLSGNPDDILNTMVSSNSIKQFSSSWGYSVDSIANQVYQQMALQGQSYFNASGDGDSWVGPIPFQALENPYVTIVGGTTLTMRGRGVSYVTEQAWNSGFTGDYGHNPDGFSGTGGGVSTDVLIPSWQQAVDMTTNHGSTVFRNTPDVALTSDNVFLVSSGGNQGVSGGTSAASPLWAGFMACVNQRASQLGHTSVGFLNPQIYALGVTNPLYSVVFHDIVTGSNTWDQSPTNYYCVPGYDLCTGWGTPNGTNFINYFATNTALANSGSNNIVAINPPPAPYGTTLSSLIGSTPNGTWSLFVQDINQYNTGMISNGWYVTMTLGSPLSPIADVGVAMTNLAASVNTGGKLLYCITVTNYGGFGPATNVVVEDSLPGGAAYVSNSVTAGTTTYNGDIQNGYHFTWTVGNLAANAGAKLILAVQAPGFVTNMVNYAFASATTPDPNPDDNTIALSVPVVAGTPQLSAAVSSSSGRFNLTIGAGSGSVIIYASTNLQTWTPIYTNTAPFTYTENQESNYPYRFYRAMTGQ